MGGIGPRNSRVPSKSTIRIVHIVFGIVLIQFMKQVKFGRISNFERPVQESSSLGRVSLRDNFVRGPGRAGGFDCVRWAEAKFSDQRDAH